MKHSIKKQFAFYFIGILIGTIIVYWFANAIFLKKFYVINKQKVIIEAYEQLNQANSENSMASDEFKYEMSRLCDTYNISIMVMDAEMKVLISVQSDDRLLHEQLVDYFINGVNNGDIIKQTKSYMLQLVFDTRTQSEYIEMWGKLDNGNIFLIRSALDGIEDSARVASTFLLYAGIIIVIISIAIIMYFTRKITKPILRLARISERMTHLDFDAKYPVQGHNEIDLLGENINQLSDTLEKTISELKTANNELKNDIEKKEKTDEMRKEFLSNVSHELKTPIALIQGYAEGLKEGINDDIESKEFYCDVIIDEANKMNIMVKNLLSLNELEFGNDTIQVERFDIAEMIHNYLASMEILLRQNGITLIFDNERSICVWGDEFKTEEVFRNYFSNAMNHVSGDKVIKVILEESDKKLRVTVFNTGSCIPDDSIDLIWDKFYKVDKARTREYGGSGVGLSIVKAIMSAMNQQYGVRNTEDGVAFWFELDME